MWGSRTTSSAKPLRLRRCGPRWLRAWSEPWGQRARPGSAGRRDWELVRANRAKAQAVDPHRVGAESAWVALALDHAYEAFETMLVRIERALAMPERSGAAWHRVILADAGAELSGLRPSLVPAESADGLEKLLGFRHFLRHAYAAELQASRLARLTEQLASAVEATEPSVGNVLSALRDAS